MSVQEQLSGLSGEPLLPDEEQVCAFLRQHADFFKSHRELLDEMLFPHESGEAVSLVMAQLCRLREKSLHLEQQLADMLTTARANDVLYRRLQEITLFLLTARSFQVAEAGLLKQLKELFDLDAAVLRIVEPVDIERVESAHDAVESAVLVFIEQGEPSYQLPSALTAAYLWGSEVESHSVGSCLQLPLCYENLRGVLLLGSADASRFRPGMDHEFLHQMAEIIAVRIHALY